MRAMLRGCKIKVFSVLSILILLMVETWQALALGKDYFLELENWFELLILSLAVSTLCLKAELDSLAIVASVGICLAWIELIFQFGRYPSLGGTFRKVLTKLMEFVIQFFLCSYRKTKNSVFETFPQYHVLLNHQEDHPDGEWHCNVCLYV